MSPLLTHLVQGQVPGETGISFPINLFGIALRKGGPRPTSPTLWGLTITVNVVLVVAQLPALLADLSTRVAPELATEVGDQRMVDPAIRIGASLTALIGVAASFLSSVLRSTDPRQPRPVRVTTAFQGSAASVRSWGRRCSGLS